MKIIIQFIIIHSTVRLSLSPFLPFHGIYYEIFFKAKTSNYIFKHIYSQNDSLL